MPYAGKLASMEQPHHPSLIGTRGPVEGGAFALAGDEISIGRDHTNTLAINDRSISRRRCASRNGTAVNGLPVTARALADGDEIRIG
jgi:pSer/pThr/pTyr-binding forkhead associated (FHA) protein